ncbi:MAG: NYN domain-containing protein [Candidatus Micrarchaeia archaeon]|jgi:uncharacterized LabA/DUF88 family protein
MEKTAIFIDNGYLKLILKKFNCKLRIQDFSINLAKENNLWCDKIFFYTAPPFQSAKPTEEERIRKASYDKFIITLKKIDKLIIREGRCQKINDIFHQKGVDTLLTMDLFESFLEYKNVIIITADTDFVPILENLRKKGMNVILYYYTDKKRNSKFSMSNHLLDVCDKSILLNKKHFNTKV